MTTKIFQPISFRFSLLAFAALLALCSCDKDDPEEPIPSNETLNIVFDNTTIPIAMVDSAFVIFQKKGNPIEQFQRFDKQNGKLTLSINSLSKGEWKARLFVYGGAPNTTTKREYIETIVFNVTQLVEEVTLKAPKGNINDDWKHHAMFTQHPELIVVVPLDNTDPYFEIRVSDVSKWENFFVQRTAMLRESPQSGNEIKASQTWQCASNCFNLHNNIVDSTSFKSFSEIVKTKTHNNGEIDVLVTDKQGNATEFFYPYKL